MVDTVYIPDAMTYLDEDDGHVYIITFLLQVAATQVNQPEMFSRDSPHVRTSSHRLPHGSPTRRWKPAKFCKKPKCYA